MGYNAGRLLLQHSHQRLGKLRPRQQGGGAARSDDLPGEQGEGERQAGRDDLQHRAARVVPVEGQERAGEGARAAGDHAPAPRGGRSERRPRRPVLLHRHQRLLEIQLPQEGAADEGPAPPTEGPPRTRAGEDAAQRLRVRRGPQRVRLHVREEGGEGGGARDRRRDVRGAVGLARRRGESRRVRLLREGVSQARGGRRTEGRADLGRLSAVPLGRAGGGVRAEAAARRAGVVRVAASGVHHRRRGFVPGSAVELEAQREGRDETKGAATGSSGEITHRRT
mmetsp:Transcript_1269/g.2751  ORF Transcript_1269/g.2751 Transcript_1269/m.2751 type:complete len:281 (-) Transcript_1269:29-871(-)